LAKLIFYTHLDVFEWHLYLDMKKYYLNIFWPIPKIFLTSFKDSKNFKIKDSTMRNLYFYVILNILNYTLGYFKLLSLKLFKVILFYLILSFVIEFINS
jgi:hypothetical protein